MISDNRGICRSATVDGVTIGKMVGQVSFVTALSEHMAITFQAAYDLTGAPGNSRNR
jgi:hypothetical protein